MRYFLFIFIVALAPITLFAQTTNNLSPGAPGHDAQWESAGKQGVGTSASLNSKVWFTLGNGGMTEVYYPTVDVANVRLLQLIIVSDEGRRVETEASDTTHVVEVPNPQALTFRQINTAKSGAYIITKTYLTDPERNSVFVDVNFKWNASGACRCGLYVYYDPSLGNSGMHDSAWRDGVWVIATDADTASAFTVIGDGIADETNGYFGTSDGLTQLQQAGRITRYLRAVNGNVVQVARMNFPMGQSYGRPSSSHQFTLILSFGRTPEEAIKSGQASIRKGFKAAKAEYERGWEEYTKSLRRVRKEYQRQFNMAAMILKAHEDKTYHGAMVASLTVPWGGGPNANEPNVGGYHTVWARDLYQVATAFHAMGDKAAARRALNYLFEIQQKPDGSFPQNSWLDGRPAGGGLQMDQVAYPLILAYQLRRTDKETWLKHVKPAADFILRKGPATPQERWEEEAGYSPSTIAAEIAGLVCAAEIARQNKDLASAEKYLATADEWAGNVDRWTATTNGPYGDKNYYLRISDDDDPNDGARLEINSNGGTYDEREIVDAGFLELVRLGIKAPLDPLITKSLAVVDKHIRVDTPHGAAWYRYNHDAYGEQDDGGRYDARAGRGRLWTLLNGERGEYELAGGQKALARTRLDAMMKFANHGGMIPEQVWDKPNSPSRSLEFGEGTGSATPLAWSMAQFIRLAINLQEGRNLETPDIVAARYLKPK